MKELPIALGQGLANLDLARTRSPPYGCIYIALAEAEGLRFVTADASLVRKVGR